MSSMTITDGGGLAVGQGIGNAIKAFAMADGARARAGLDADLKRSSIDQHAASAAKSNNEAAILAERLGLMRDPLKAVMLQNNVPLIQRGAIESYQATGGMPADNMGPPMPPPIDPALMATINKALGLSLNTHATGSNVQQMANARDIGHKTDMRQAILDGSQDPTLAAQARFGVDGGPAVFSDVGNTGVAQNNATGDMEVASQALLDIFAGKENALANQRSTAATANKARAGASDAKAEATRTGGGSGSGGAKYTLSATNARVFDKPVLDKNGKPVIDPFSSKPVVERDTVAQEEFMRWMDANGKTNANQALNEWVAAGRPSAGAKKNPAPAGANQKIVEAPKDKAERKAGTVYQTPKGPMKWTGTGWLPQ